MAFYNSFKLLIITILSSLLFYACNSDKQNNQLNNGSGCSLNSVSIVIKDFNEMLPDEYQVIVSLEENHFVSVYCDGKVKDNINDILQCSKNGVLLKKAVDTANLVVKSSGFITKRVKEKINFTEVKLEIPEAGCGEFVKKGELKIKLLPLENFEVNDDYRTGFSKETTMDDFKKLAVEHPGEVGRSFIIKFYMDNLNSNPRVFFQNTQKHKLHYGFVRGVLNKTLSLSEYESQTYNGENRNAMAGSILLYPNTKIKSSFSEQFMVTPITIEFFPSDDLSAELALKSYTLIEERMQFIKLNGNELRLFYLPATNIHEEQLKEAQNNYTKNGALWLFRNELYGNLTLQILNHGIAYGQLRVLTPDELKKTAVSFKDILILTRLPNELPVVGGTITEELQTPLAHVNVAARSRKTPNIALLKASENEDIIRFINNETIVKFEVTALGYSIEESTLTEAQNYWDNRIPGETVLPHANTERSGLLLFNDIGFDDSESVGVKAANLAELYNLLKEENNAPNGFGVPFYYYEQFMSNSIINKDLFILAKADCREESREEVVCQKVYDFCMEYEGNETLHGFLDRMLINNEFKLNTLFREALLDSFKYFIHHINVNSEFKEMLDTAVKQTFGSENARMRSSTNSEDLENFSGAGLYRSVSANFREANNFPSSKIRKVWASIWNFKAFEERTFWNIDHKAVKMGVAVSRAFPYEKANGVLITQNISNPAIDGYYVNVQYGETSVTNPENGALPEVFSIIHGASGIEVIRQRYSSLLNNISIMSDPEINELYYICQKVQNHFAVLYGSESNIALDLEFKIDGYDRNLFIKQVRPYFKVY